MTLLLGGTNVKRMVSAGMTDSHYEAFLERIINSGIEAAKRDYANSPLKLKGAIAGFEACRGLQPEELLSLLNAGRLCTKAAYRTGAKDYWRTRCFEVEVEWVCNCVSAELVNSGKEPIVTVTARGMIMAANALAEIRREQ